MISVKSIKDWVWRKLCERMHLDWTLPSGVKVQLRSYADWCIYNEIFVCGEYDAAIDHTLANPVAATGAPLRVLDLGANVGYFSLRFADLCLRRQRTAELTLVEPSPDSASELRHRMAVLERLGVTVTIKEGLVGQRSGKARLNLGREANVNSVDHHKGWAWQAYRGSVEVPYIDLDDVHAGEPIDLLKCDIEGSEFELFEVYPELLKRTRCLAAEFHPTLGDVAAALERLRQAGFTCITELRSEPLTSIWMASREPLNPDFFD
jgi:FkbM family methyltransferase